MKTNEFIKRVKERASLDNDKQAFMLIQAVFRTLHERLPEGEADNIEATLPHELQEIWEGSWSRILTKKMGVIKKYDKSQFVSHVQNLSRLSSNEEAEMKTKVVLSVLKKAIPEAETDDVAAELPPDLRQYWLNA